ncbi:hypothetical protein [Cystobacter ferrugineus]|uniref:STAS/SEC14 domain-containing protein n=1 Tax=Cystobacter ferrugineus TaxID=83449 RepID=A0A1L9B101_9BACT|nr:hypothetical protein [Cystobacter ferrugineus]OJH35896.1 hypothetical protein BON30_35340 [Cystobacter ferrugineus]
MSFQREEREGGEVRLKSERCTFIYWRPRPGVVVLRIVGEDRGEFGTAPMDELRGDISRYAPLELFIEMEDSAEARMPVQEAWTDWFNTHRSALKSVSILTRSKYMHFTAEMVKFFSRTGELIRVYLEEAPFEEALQRAAPSARRPRT